MGACCGYSRSKLLSSHPSPVIKPHAKSRKSPIHKKSPINSLSSLSNSSDKTKLSTSSFRFKNGDSYTGESLNNKPNGEGKYTSSKGYCYQGNWKNGNPHGKGKGVYPNEAGKFTGDYENGNKNGLGKICFEEGSVYEGSLINNDF